MAVADGDHVRGGAFGRATERDSDHGGAFATSARSDAIVARAVLVGSSTINNGPLPTIMPVMTDMKGLKFKNKIGAAFGSYGWSGEAPKQVEELLRGAGVEIVKDAIKFKWQPKPEELDACRAFGREIGEMTKKPLASYKENER